MANRGGPLERLRSKAMLVYNEVFNLGPRTMAAIAAESLAMARHEASWRRAHESNAAFEGPGEMTASSTFGAPGFAHGHGVTVTFERDELEVAFLSPSLVRLSWASGQSPVPYALSDDAPFVAPELEVAEYEAGLRLTSAELVVEVGRDAAVRVSRVGGPVALSYEAPQRQGQRVRLSIARRAGEVLSGLGEQAQGLALEAPVRLFNRDPGGAWGVGQNPLYCSIPVVVAVDGGDSALTFVENPFESSFEPGDGTSTWTFEDGKLQVYASVGAVPELLSRYADLTGHAARPPRWALGFHQCRWGYKSEADVRRVADGFATRGLPVSAIHCDIDYMDDYRVFTFSPERFPDMGVLTAELKPRGARIVTIIDPALKADPSWSLYEEGVAQGHFATTPEGEVYHGTVWPGRAAFPDFTRPATRAWWGERYATMTEQGVAGIWHDMNEPTSITLSGDRTLPRDLRFDLEGRGGEQAEAHNLYGLQMNRAGYDGLAAAEPSRRPFIVSRSGWAGMQRYAWNWTADVESSFAGLRQQVATVVGLGLSGVPFSGSDIGGFSGTPSTELFVRWFEMATLHPFMRTHSVLGVPSREPWTFDDGAEELLSGLIALRYRLLPYLYTVADEAVSLGHPASRPRWWFDGKPGAGDDEGFCVGDRIFVAPVTLASATSSDVQLPAGRWRAWRPQGLAGAPADGFGPACEGLVRGVSTPLGQPALFLAEGSVVVTDDAWCADELPALSLDHRVLEPTITVACDGHGAAVGSWYDDAGDGHGPSQRSTFTASSTDHGTRALSWITTGEYPRPSRLRVRLLDTVASSVLVDGVEHEAQVAGNVTEVLVPAFTHLEWRP